MGKRRRTAAGRIRTFLKNGSGKALGKSKVRRLPAAVYRQDRRLGRQSGAYDLSLQTEG